MKTRDHYIKLFRKNGFNCFPIPNNQKIADSRYQASRTIPNQEIKDTENYGIIPTLGKGNCIVDFDDKERYRKFAEHMISKGYMVSETGRGWHLPVIGLTGNIQKVELFDYNYQPNEKIIEIQGINHYCVGVGSVILHDKLEKQITYENKGSDKIFDVKGKDFHQFIDELCSQCQVQGRKKKSGSSYQFLRERFVKGLIPLKGSSNDYFHQAALVCNTDGLTKDEALKKIKVIYDKWSSSEYFTDRPFSNIETKVNEVYENDDRITKGRPSNKDDKLDRTGIAKDILTSRELYSDVETHQIFENKNGFLERINDTLKRELYDNNPEIEKTDQDSILFKLEAGAKPYPETNKDEIVFSNGKFNVKLGKISKTKDIADMGFKDYKYLPKSKKNEPKEFLKLLENFPKHEHPRFKAGLKAIFNGRFDSRISIIHGKSRVGKSTMMDILCEVLGSEYAYPVPLKQFLEDRATQANALGKRLVVFQEFPEQWKEFDTLKTMTGEKYFNFRGFNRDNKVGENKIKFFGSANNLPEIKSSEKNAMYTARISLIHNTRLTPYEEGDKNGVIENIIKNEAEKIVSWIINLSDKDCQYEDGKTVKQEWEKLATPEIEYFENNYEIKTDETESNISLMTVLKDFIEKTGREYNVKQFRNILLNQGFIVSYNVIKNISIKEQKKKTNEVLA